MEKYKDIKKTKTVTGELKMLEDKLYIFRSKVNGKSQAPMKVFTYTSDIQNILDVNVGKTVILHGEYSPMMKMVHIYVLNVTV